jgi:hypothetical protein
METFKGKEVTYVLGTSCYKSNRAYLQIYLATWLLDRSRGSSVSIVTDYELGDRDSIPDRGRGFFF